MRRREPWWRDADYADALEREIEDLTRDLRHCHGRDREEQRERIASLERVLAKMFC